MDVAECRDCDEIAVGPPALDWALRHTSATGHATTTRSALGGTAGGREA